MDPMDGMTAPQNVKAIGLATMGRRVAPPRIERTRVCASRGCRTVLSKFNPGNRCWVHEPAVVKPVRGIRRPAGDAA